MSQSFFDRRQFVHGVAGLAGVSALRAIPSHAAPVQNPPVQANGSERAIRALFESLTDKQKRDVCFDWDYRAIPAFGSSPRPAPEGRGLPLRLHVSNAWRITRPAIGSAFFTREQQELIDAVVRTIFQGDWPKKLAQQFQDDTGQRWGQGRSVAIFGVPGKGPCQCVLTGFHLTARALADSESHVAFGGAIAHGHQPSGFNEKPGHPNNIFWYQALQAHKVFQMLDGKQRAQAMVAKGMPYYEFGGKIDRTLIVPTSKLERPLESDVRFRGPKAQLPGLPVAGMTRDQKEGLRGVLASLLEPYQQVYRDKVLQCLDKQGGLDRCHLIYYEEHTHRRGDWDNWRVEGPAFVWYFRGFPHVHIWIHVAGAVETPVTSYFG